MSLSLIVLVLIKSENSFIKTSSIKIAVGVLICAYTIEFMQFINLLEILKLNNNHLVKLVLGSTFHVSDLIAYTLGIITVLIVENTLKKS